MSDRSWWPLPRVAQLALTGVLALLAVALCAWLLLRPGPAAVTAGGAPGLGIASSGASAAATQGPSSAPAAGGAASPGPSTPASPAAAPVPVAFVGDGVAPAGGVLDATGAVGPVSAGTTAPAGAAGGDWTARLAAALAATGRPITPAVAGAAGAGYTRLGGGLNIAELTPQVVTPSTRVVVLLGSRNDLSAPATTVQAAAATTLANIATTAPRARVLLVGPVPVLGGSASLGADRAGLRAAAEAGYATYLDPQAAGWVLGAGTTTTDGGTVRLTAAGQAYIAAKLLPKLRTLVTAAAPTAAFSALATPALATPVGMVTASPPTG